MPYIKQEVHKIKEEWFKDNFIDYQIIAKYDMVEEVAEEYDLTSYTIQDVMKDRDSKDFYVCGAFCVVRNELGCLTIYNSKNTKYDVYLTNSYLFAKYYKLSDINNIFCK